MFSSPSFSTFITLLFLFSCSSDRSFTPTHHSYYSPKHEGLLDEMLTSHQVPSVWPAAIIVTIITTTGFYIYKKLLCFGSSFQPWPGRTRGTRTDWAGGRRTWTTWLYPPAPSTPGTHTQPLRNTWQITGPTIENIPDVKLWEHFLNSLVPPQQSCWCNSSGSFLFTTTTLHCVISFNFSKVLRSSVKSLVQGVKSFSLGSCMFSIF